MGRIASVALVLILVGAAAARAEEKAARTISVSGTAEAQVVPDRIIWEITLTDTDKNLLAAKKRNDDRVKSVLALRKKLEVAEGDAETGSVSVSREYEHDERGYQRDFKHFLVTRRVTIRQRDLKRFDEFLESLVTSTEMEVGFRLESSRRLEVRAETRLKALQVAKEKAAAMAAVVGVKLGRVLRIDEFLPDRGYRDYDRSSNAVVSLDQPAADVATDTFAPGTINVQVTVYAVFELE